MEIQKFIFKPNNKLAEFQTHEIIADANKALKNSRAELSDLQDIMYADDRYSLLICLQGMDTSGKDSLTREVFKDVNVNGINVHSFKTPNAEELSHDYIWRHYLKLPERGKIAVFNRTHYENVLVTKVHPEYVLAENIPQHNSLESIDNSFFDERMEQINSFEKHLSQNGTIVLKFYLNLSKKEQKKRLLRRLEKPNKNWKFSEGDLKERKLWDQYMKAYEEMLSKTSKDSIPWYVIPADDKETCRFIISSIIVDVLKKIDFKYPILNELEKNNLENYKFELEKD